MQSFNLWPEQRMRVIRWSLLFGWEFLILSPRPGIGINGNSILGKRCAGWAFHHCGNQSRTLAPHLPAGFCFSAGTGIGSSAQTTWTRRKTRNRQGATDSARRHHIELQWSLLTASVFDYWRNTPIGPGSSTAWHRCSSTDRGLGLCGGKPGANTFAQWPRPTDRDSRTLSPWEHCPCEQQQAHHAVDVPHHLK